ncbi:WXG100 family type VII secretion target [Paenibacillus ihumii]|uniref:WXG100 family type VII secretion target n=1 Tax=Paenibacillus ihumii TaxID=687436 RepID=UPI0006D84441|nr:WXG100 family type VII secretion target [Paenibacillus ihumii]
MSTPSAISGTARNIRNELGEVKREEGRLQAELAGVSSWWKGSAGKALTDSYQSQTRNELGRLYAEIENLQSGLERLATEVHRAEEQRRIEAQQKAMQLQQQRNAKK